MNRQIFNKGKKITHAEHFDLINDIKSGKTYTVNFTAEQLEKIETYMLKSDGISHAKDDTIIIQTNNNKYTFTFYNGFVLLDEHINANNCIYKKERNFYKIPIEKLA